MRSAAMAVVVLGAGLVLAGCATPAARTPEVRVVEAVKPSPVRALDQALPTADELVAMLGAGGLMGQLVKGGGDVLLQSVGKADATPLDCVSTGYQLQKVVYQGSPVRSVASRSWAGGNPGGDLSGPSATGFFGAVQFASAEDAQAFFASSADKWHRCNGRTLVLQHAGQRAQRITDVAVDDRIVSAVVMQDAGSTMQRALGVASDCVVDVEISDVAGPAATGARDAAAVANLMLQKIGVS